MERGDGDMGKRPDHRADKPGFVVSLPCLADALQHEPSRFLGHADIAVKLHAGDALEAGQMQIDRQGPLA